MGHIKAIFLSGLIWLLLGVALTYMGLYLVVSVMQQLLSGSDVPGSFIACLLPVVSQVEKSALFAVSLSLGIGFIYGRYGLRGAVKKVVQRILNTPSPVKFKQLFLKRYILLACSLGVSFALLFFVGLVQDICGVLAMIIGSALIHGALLYFRHAAALRSS